VKGIPSGYAALFREFQPTHDPRHIEAYVRLQYGTLDHLTRDELRAEAEIGAACVDAHGVEHAEALAETYGL